MTGDTITAADRCTQTITACATADPSDALGLIHVAGFWTAVLALIATAALFANLLQENTHE